MTTLIAILGVVILIAQALAGAFPDPYGALLALIASVLILVKAFLEQFFPAVASNRAVSFLLK